MRIAYILTEGIHVFTKVMTGSLLPFKVNFDLMNVDYANQPSLTGKDFSKSRNITSQKDMNDAARF